MERENGPQLELFLQSNETQGFSPKPHNELLSRIWAYEKTILIIIAILVTGIIAFSMGVEKGKRIVLIEQARTLAPVKPQGIVVQPQVIVKKEEAIKQPATLAAQQEGAFTIQVASFRTKANARREAEIIKKKGFSAMLLSKGDYVIVCVGNFPNKEAAQPLVKELSKRYGNCQIRRL